MFSIICGPTLEKKVCACVPFSRRSKNFKPVFWLFVFRFLFMFFFFSDVTESQVLGQRKTIIVDPRARELTRELVNIS